MVLKVETGSLPGFTVQEGKLEFTKENYFENRLGR
jgi:hypothetical protein